MTDGGVNTPARRALSTSPEPVRRSCAGVPTRARRTSWKFTRCGLDVAGCPGILRPPFALRERTRRAAWSASRSLEKGDSNPKARRRADAYAYPARVPDSHIRLHFRTVDSYQVRRRKDPHARTVARPRSPTAWACPVDLYRRPRSGARCEVEVSGPVCSRPDDVGTGGGRPAHPPRRAPSSPPTRGESNPRLPGSRRALYH